MSPHRRAGRTQRHLLVALVTSIIAGCIGSGGGSIRLETPRTPPAGPAIEFPPESRTPIEVPLEEFGEVRLPEAENPKEGIRYTLTCGAEGRPLPGFEVKVDDDGPLLVGQAPAEIDPPIACRLSARDGQRGRGETNLYVRTKPEAEPAPLAFEAPAASLTSYEVGDSVLERLPLLTGGGTLYYYGPLACEPALRDAGLKATPGFGSPIVISGTLTQAPVQCVLQGSSMFGGRRTKRRHRGPLHDRPKE